MKKILFEILNIIYDYCIDDSYKVIDVNDIILGLPSGMVKDKVDVERVFEIVEELATEDTIDLKYKDEEDICLAITAKGRRIVKHERETREKIEQQRQAKLEEEARLKALKEAEEKARLEQEERDRQERLLKEKQLEEARLALEEVKANKRLKKAPEAQELEQIVQELENEIIEDFYEGQEKSDEECDEVILPDIRQDNSLIDYDRIRIKARGGYAFVGALFGAMMGNAIFFLLKHFIGF